jgi:hypothetical protein
MGVPPLSRPLQASKEALLHVQHGICMHLQMCYSYSLLSPCVLCEMLTFLAAC